MKKCKTIFNSFLEGESNAQLSLGNMVRSILYHKQFNEHNGF